MTNWVHFILRLASLVSLLGIRLSRAQREALRDIEARCSGPVNSGIESRNSITGARHV